MSKTDDFNGKSKRPPGQLMHESYAPLQMPSNQQDRRTYTATYGGPEAGLDTRMLITGKMLEHMNKVAAQSHVGAATINCVGLQIDVYVTPEGHQYEIWSFIGHEPVPAKSWRG